MTCMIFPLLASERFKCEQGEKNSLEIRLCYDVTTINACCADTINSTKFYRKGKMSELMYRFIGLSAGDDSSYAVEIS